MPPHWRLGLREAAVTALLLILFLQLLAVNHRTSMSWDEGHHLFDGYTILKHHDFNLNPRHGEAPTTSIAISATPTLTGASS